MLFVLAVAHGRIHTKDRGGRARCEREEPRARRQERGEVRRGPGDVVARRGGVTGGGRDGGIWTRDRGHELRREVGDRRRLAAAACGVRCCLANGAVRVTASPNMRCGTGARHESATSEPEAARDIECEQLR